MGSGIALAEGEPYVASIPFERNGITLSEAEPLHLTLTLKGAARVAERYARSTLTVESVRDGEIDLVVNGRDRFTAPPAPRHLAASFVIDFDEPEIAPLDAEADALRAQSDAPPSTDALARLVFAALPEKTYARSFDLASQAVRAGAGDCTEHAVVMAALARAQGLPSRVVFGALILGDADGAYGHAWTEVYVDGAWQLADATLPESYGETVFYVPLSTFDNEGPGYGLGLFEALQSLPSRVTVRGASTD